MSACPIPTAPRLLAALMIAALAGCASEGGTEAPAGSVTTPAAPLTAADLLPQNRTPIADLPVPVGFKLVESVSRSYDWGTGRVIDHTYEGHADKLAIDRFYRRQMTTLGWIAGANENVRGYDHLEFTSSARPERCVIQITDAAPRIDAPVRITLTVLPAGPAPKP